MPSSSKSCPRRKNEGKEHGVFMQKSVGIEYLENGSQIQDFSQDYDLGILIHGYGADAYDLQSLGDILKGSKPIRWICPQGMESVPIGPGWTGRAWWPLSMSEVQKAAERGEHIDFTEIRPEQLPKVRSKMLDFIQSFKTPWNKIILAGFSQGGMLATDLFFNAPEAPKALMIFSGTLINKTEWKSIAPKRQGSSFFMCHGSQDPVLSHAGSQKLESLLTQSGLKGKLFSFQGTHEIPMQAINKANEYLHSI